VIGSFRQRQKTRPLIGGPKVPVPGRALLQPSLKSGLKGGRLPVMFSRVTIERGC
jgi:hypothetical protein